MDIKTPKYNYKAQVSFEKRRLFSRSLVKGTIISYRYVNYTWLYLIECSDCCCSRCLTAPWSNSLSVNLSHIA